MRLMTSVKSLQSSAAVESSVSIRMHSLSGISAALPYKAASKSARILLGKRDWPWSSASCASAMVAKNTIEAETSLSLNLR